MIRLNGLRIDLGYPEDRDRAEERLGELESCVDPEADGNVDGVVNDS